MRAPASSLVASGVLALTLSCAPAADQGGPAAEPEMTEGEALEIFDALVEEFDVALNSGNVDAIMAMYGGSPSAMPPDAPAISGADAVRDFWAGFFGAGTVEGDNVLGGFRVDGDLAVIWGTYTTTVTPEGGEAATESGKWMGILERQADGSWTVLRNIWNTDAAGDM